MPPIPGIQSAQVLDSDTVFELKRVPEKAAIIGGGYIGLEFACFFNEIGSQVSVYEMLPQIATGADQEISSRMLQIMKRKGIEFNLSAKVLGIEGDTVQFQAADGSQRQRHGGLHSERHRALAECARTWGWKSWAWISAPKG